MTFDHTISLWTATIKFDMYAADNKPTITRVFADYDECKLLIESIRKEFVKEFDIPHYFHDYGDISSDGTELTTVNRSIEEAIHKYHNHEEDMLISESDTQDRMFARIDYHTL